MDFGLCLPNFRDGASPEAIEAAAEVTERLGWSTVWTTDHVLVPHEFAETYGNVYDAILALAWVGARHPHLRLGTSVIVVPQRNGVLLAKELATLDSLSAGRVIAGVGVGWNRAEFGNLAVEDRFQVRGAYLEETIRLWRHLWSGSTEPFRGRFNTIEDFVFGPLPTQGAHLPIVIGGDVDRALRRAGAMADGYHSSSIGPSEYTVRLPILRAAAEGAGRPMPWLSARVSVGFDGVPATDYAMRGTPEAIAAEIKAFGRLGVTHLALWFGSEPARLVHAAERFSREVEPLVLA